MAVCIPSVRLGNPVENAASSISLSEHADKSHAAIVVFPELGLSGYSNEDLFHQDALLDASVAALSDVVQASRALAPLLIVGAPLLVEQKLFNCAVAIHRGVILDATSKTYLPNYREFYERRQFTSGTHRLTRELALLSARVPFGNDILYHFSSVRGGRFTSRSVKTCGSRFRPARLRPWLAVLCWSTFRPATSRLARPTIGACCVRRSPGAALPPMRTLPPDPASPPPISLGMATGWSMRTGSCWRKRNALRQTSR
jgi:Carbon-nitrogen hydrolase